MEDNQEENKTTTPETTEKPVEQKQEVPKEEQPVQEQPKQEPPKQETPKQEVKQEKPKKKKKAGLIASIIIILLAIIAGAVGGAVYAIVFAKTEVDLAKYVSIEFSGYEGYASFDEEDLVIDQKGLKKLLDSKKTAQKLAEKLLAKVQMSENENVKNGDKIEVKFKVSEDWLKENKIKLASNTIKIEVKDLEEPNSIDLFEGLEFSYSGISPNLTVSLKNTSSDNFVKNKVTYTMEKDGDEDSSSSYSLYNVANGDKIIVSATYSQSDLESAGYAVAEDEYSFTVKDQASYVEKADEITSDIQKTLEEKMLEKVKSIAKNSTYAVTSAYHEDFSDAEHYDYNLTNADPELVKMYIAVNKDMEDIGWYDSRNLVYGIYKVTFTDTTTSKTYDYYIATYVEDLVTDEDGLYTGKTYYYNEYYNGSYTPADDSDYHRSSDEVYKAIEESTKEDYTLSEVK
ncbi:MAG: hypothetical protein IJ867_05700 [Clostridia bacterium]|nr:hypothetical protein [Clostridia bacterium]